MAVEIHLHSVVFSDCCLINITSIVVRHSWQLGVAILFTRSHRLLQSVIRRAFVSCCREISGVCHLKIPSLTIAHMHLTQVSLSRDEDIAYASALSVERTTLLICLECHEIGDISDIWLVASSLVHAAMNTPCRGLSCDSDAKLASPKLAKVTCCISIG